jgi:branched-subunit amino acid transport protein
MKQIYVFLVAMICLTLSFDAQAQCNYQLELTDFFGNDWDSGANATANAGVDVTIDGVLSTYLIINPSITPNASVTELYTITVNDMSTIDIDYRSTHLPGDGQLRLIDSEGLLVYESPIAQSSMMDVYVGNASCPTCLIVSNAASSSVTANEAVISWTNGASETEWEIEYGISPYTPNNGGLIVAVTTNPFTLTGLSSESIYDVYVRAVCVTGTDISNSVGPITFTTPESCPAPSNFVAITQSAFEIQFAWDANGNTSSNYEVDYGVSPYAQGAAGGTTVTGSTGSFAAVGNLMSNTTYDFYVRYDCGMGDFSTWQGAYTAATTISCPVITALQATVTSSTLDIIWTAGGSETQWEVEYAVAGVITTPGTGQGTSATQMAPTSLSLMGLTPDTTYDVYIRAICDASTNDFSQLVTASFTTAVSCPAISALQAVATDSTLDITWAAGGSETEWEIEYAVAGVITAPGTGQGTNATQMAPTSVSLSGLTSATSYDVYVRAICDAGTQDWSLWVNATFLVLPNAPNGVSCPNNDSAYT